jgi:DNA-binding IclR family transcriptional regulator
VSGNNVELGRTVTSKLSAILQTFAQGAEHSMTEVARLTGLPQSTTHRLMTELTSRRLLERRANGRYGVGLALRMIGAADPAPASIVERGPWILEDIADCAKSRARLGVLQGLDVCYLERIPGTPSPTSVPPSATVPAHSMAMGLALLAFAPEETVARAIHRPLHQHSPHVLPAPDRLRHALSVIRLSRVASIRPKHEADVHTVAVPVFGPGGKVIAAFELALQDVDHDFAAAVAILTIASRSLSRELGSETQNPYAADEEPMWTA